MHSVCDVLWPFHLISTCQNLVSSGIKSADATPYAGKEISHFIDGSYYEIRHVRPLCKGSWCRRRSSERCQTHTQSYRKEVEVCEIKDGKEQVDASTLGREKQSRQRQNYIRKSA